ncbi:MAG: DUF4845 domain-containing protein [Steroidobacteraceae bacterium]
MFARQRGVTAIGWLILLTPFAILIYVAMRVTPVMMNYMSVARSLSAMQGEFAGGGASPDAIRSALQKHFDVESVDYPAVKDINITRAGQGWTIEAAYYDQAPLFSHVSLQLQFDKTVTVGGG